MVLKNKVYFSFLVLFWLDYIKYYIILFGNNKAMTIKISPSTVKYRVDKNT